MLDKTKIVDSHCHLHMLDNIESAVENAKNSGLGCLLNVATMWSDNQIISDIVNKYNIAYGSVGIHPSSSEDCTVSVEDIINIINKNNKIIAIGECGFDFYHDDNPSMEVQEKVFVNQIYAAQETGKPLIIHTRNADYGTIRVLKREMAAKKFKFIIHCFSGTSFLAEESLSLGGYISISGIITFKKSDELRLIVKNIVPLQKLLIETDCPYLTPEPLRGRVSNEPAYIVNTVNFLSELLSISNDQLINYTSSNFCNLFDL